MQAECAYTQLQTEEIRRELARRLSPQRFDHSCKVAEIAVHFARTVGCDERKAEIAGLLHDVAREFTQEQTDEAVKKYSIRLSRYNLSFPPSIHGKVGSLIAEREFGICDEEILAAIRNHVSGRPCMSTLEQVVFLADHIGRELKFMPEDAEILMNGSLDESMYKLLGHIIRYDARNRKPIDERSLQTFDWLLGRIRNEAKTGPVDVSEQEMLAFYSRMDELLELCSEHAITDLPAENLRDLGGYPARDGRRIRRRRILRAGNPDRFTPGDFEKLAAMGINTLIDLRTDGEKTHKPDLGRSRIRWLDIPFDATCECKSYLELLLEWINECDDPEESAWLTARYFDAFDIDDMYMKLLLDPSSREKFRQILTVMLREDCTGILFFCHSGKDRTGIVTSVIMNALGIGHDTALDDYMVSQIPYYAITMKYLNQLRKKDYNLTVQKQVIAVLGVESERPKRLNREILSRFGDYKSYFDFEGCFSTDELEKFRNKYLE